MQIFYSVLKCFFNVIFSLCSFSVYFVGCGKQTQLVILEWYTVHWSGAWGSWQVIIILYVGI